MLREYVGLFNKHRESIENFITSIINTNSLDCSNEAKIHNAFKNLHPLETLYIVDDNYIQKSPTFFAKGKDESRIGVNKEQYFSNIRFNDKDIYMTNPYIHHRSGKSSITVVKRKEDKFIIFDFDLLKLLEELKLIQHNSKFDMLNRFAYAVAGILLSIISIFLLLYGGYVFIKIFFISAEMDIIHDVFKSIIAITLGIAIYDLAKTIIANEVLFKTIELDQGGQYNILGKFLTSIIIALSIESLMVVFKIALDDYTSLGYAFFLILGVTLMIIGLGIFHYFTRDKCSVS